MPWPQISIAVWLVVSIISGITTAATSKRGFVVLIPSHQRIAGAGFALAAIVEASLLTIGGFFHNG